MQIRQFHRVGDGLDLRVQSPDVGVTDVRHLFEDEFFGLLARQLLGEEVRTKAQRERSPRRHFPHRRGSASSATRSSSARPYTSPSRSSSTSLTVTTSPWPSESRT